MCFTESNLKNLELSNKVCRETKRLNRSINLIGLIESKNDAAGITSKGFSVCSLRSEQTPTALRYSGISSLLWCSNEIKKRRRCRVLHHISAFVTLQGLRRKDSPCIRFAQIKPRPRCGIRDSHPCHGVVMKQKSGEDVVFYIKSPLS